MTEPQNLRAAGDRIEQLLDELRVTSGPRVYDKTEELLRLVTDLYGGALTRIVASVAAADPALLARLVDDELVASLLLVHGLHPDDLSARVEKALARVRPVLETHGGDVELLDVDPAAGAVHLRLLGSCDGCPSSSVTLQSAVETAIVEAAPEITVIDVEPPSHDPVLVPANPGAASGAGATGLSSPVALISKPTYDSCPTEVAAVVGAAPVAASGAPNGASDDEAVAMAAAARMAAQMVEQSEVAAR
jgi:Fe-S cluster biogenesis protein NfuA